MLSAPAKQQVKQAQERSQTYENSTLFDVQTYLTITIPKVISSAQLSLMSAHIFSFWFADMKVQYRI